MIATLFALLVAHALCDYPLQGPYLSVAKSPQSAEGAGFVWAQALAAHALIQGGGVALVMWVSTGAWWLGPVEVVAHAAIDYAKSSRRIGYHADQALHIACKVAWVAIAFGVSR